MNGLLSFNTTSRERQDIGIIALQKEEAQVIAESKMHKNVRKLDLERVKLYAQQMNENLWRANGESIKFNKDGLLVDGQHRIRALLRSEIDSIKVSIALGLDDKDIVTLDQGKTRSLSVCTPMSLPQQRCLTGAISYGETRTNSKKKIKQKLINLWDKSYIKECILATVLPESGVRPSDLRKNNTILSVVARARYHNESSLKLDSFLDLLQNGVSSSSSPMEMDVYGAVERLFRNNGGGAVQTKRRVRALEEILRCFLNEDEGRLRVLASNDSYLRAETEYNQARWPFSEYK